MKTNRTKLVLAFLCILLFTRCSCGTHAQSFSPDRRVDWSHAGVRDSIPSYAHVVDFTQNGGKGDGTTVNDLMWKTLLANLSGKGHVIFFPAGTYKFTMTLDLPDSLVIRGAGAGLTRLLFALGGADKHCITLAGQGLGDVVPLSADAALGTQTLHVSDASTFHRGDYVRLVIDDTTLVASPWAYNTVGQIARVLDAVAGTVTLASGLRRGVALPVHPRLSHLLPRTGTGIECMTIERGDQTTTQTSNVWMATAAQCWVVGVESFKTNFAHVDLVGCTNITVQGSFFHHSYQYGSGGQGYGVTMESTSGECLVENNCFDNLRHSVLLQSGANGNVIAYNYSVNPYASDNPIPSMSPDLVLHGNYPYANLFEGNICQTVNVDDSHGNNGPYNTFFRNRVLLYGINMGTSPASDKQNFIANDVTGTGLLQGQYLLHGSDQYQFANRVKGAVTPSGTDTCTVKSLYRNFAPAFWTGSGYNALWPDIGIPYLYNAGGIPAYDRYSKSTLSDCGKYNSIVAIDATPLPADPGMKAWPNPTGDLLHLQNGERGAAFSVVDRIGRIVREGRISAAETIDMSGLENGLYFVQVRGAIAATLPVLRSK